MPKNSQLMFMVNGKLVILNAPPNFCSASRAAMKAAIAAMLGKSCGPQTSLRNCLPQDVTIIACNAAQTSRRLLSTGNNYTTTVSYSVQMGGNANQAAAAVSNSQLINAALQAQGISGVTATGSASGNGDGNWCNAGFQDVSNLCSACPAGQTSSVGGNCTACGTGTFTDAPGQAPCKPHTECDPTLVSGYASGVTNVTGTATTDTTCIANDCGKMLVEYNKHCKGTRDKPHKCTGTSHLTMRCTGIRALYRATGCQCPAPP